MELFCMLHFTEHIVLIFAGMHREYNPFRSRPQNHNKPNYNTTPRKIRSAAPRVPKETKHEVSI